jgi:hypothetical protein
MHNILLPPPGVQQVLTFSFSFISRANGFLLICGIVLSIVLSYSREPRNPLVVKSDKNLLWDCFEDSADLGDNVSRRARCESGHLALQVAKQEKVAGCTI